MINQEHFVVAILRSNRICGATVTSATEICQFVCKHWERQYTVINHHIKVALKSSSHGEIRRQFLWFQINAANEWWGFVWVFRFETNDEGKLAGMDAEVLANVTVQSVRRRWWKSAWNDIKEGNDMDELDNK